MVPTVKRKRKGFQALGGAAALVAIFVLWDKETWPFNTSPASLGAKPSLTNYLLADNVTLGFVRLAIVALGAYVIVSAPALMIGGRWLKGFGTGGISVDDAEVEDTRDESEAALKQLRRAVDTLTEERDSALELVDSFIDQMSRAEHGQLP